MDYFRPHPLNSDPCSLTHLVQEDSVVLRHQHKEVKDDSHHISHSTVELQERDTNLQQREKKVKELLDIGHPHTGGQPTHGLQQGQQRPLGVELVAVVSEPRGLHQRGEPCLEGL